jgi:TolB protein
VEIVAATNKSMPLGLLIVGDYLDPQSSEIVENIKKCLTQSSQFTIDLQKAGQFTSDFIVDYKKKQIGLVLAIEFHQVEVVWRLFDSVKLEQIAGKRVAKNIPTWLLASTISDDLWPYLTSMPGYFSTVIAACHLCKDVKKGKNVRNIEVFSPVYGLNGPRKVIVTAKTDSFAPRWHPTKLSLFYSQHTPTNIRLMAVDSSGISRIITNFNGFNLTPTFAHDGSVVLALSKGVFTHLYKYNFNLGGECDGFKQLTTQDGSYASPSFLTDDLILCEFINLNGVSRVGTFSIRNKQWKDLGVGTAYAPVAYGKDRCVFCKKNGGYLQVYLYDFNSGKEEQLTSSFGDKDEPSWSPCGNYILYSVEKKGKHRIAMSCVTNKFEWFITPENEDWSFPAWAPSNHISFILNNLS